MYYLYSAHHWGLSDLKALWEGPTGWYDLIHAMSSYEANLKKPAPGSDRQKTTVRITKNRDK